MKLTRRQLLNTTIGLGVAGAFMTRVAPVLAATDDAAGLINEFTGGAEAATGIVQLKTPEIAENGNTVPISVTVDSPMTDDSYVESIMIVAEGNPRPEVATFHFTPASGVAKASTRMRLAKTQNVIAVAKLSDGSYASDTQNVKVTIGGCGG